MCFVLKYILYERDVSIRCLISFIRVFFLYDCLFNICIIVLLLDINNIFLLVRFGF